MSQAEDSELGSLIREYSDNERAINGLHSSIVDRGLRLSDLGQRLEAEHPWGTGIEVIGDYIVEEGQRPMKLSTSESVELAKEITEIRRRYQEKGDLEQSLRARGVENILSGRHKLASHFSRYAAPTRCP